MSASFTIVVDPSPRAIARELRQLGREFRSWRPAWKAVAPLLARGMRENLLGHGSQLGESWAPLRPDTVRRKARLGRNRGPLIGTGAHILDPLGSAEVQLSATRVKVGIRGLVPSVQHFGSEKRNIPARRFAAFSPAMEAAVLAAMDSHARRLLAAAAAHIASLGRGKR